MIRLAKYLKPYVGMILLSIVLLFAQANFDLALPDYLSDIVNVGIQQGGVENAIPLALRESQMEKMLLFASGEEEAAVLDAFTLVGPASADYATALEEYPALDGAAVYLQDDLDDETIEALNPVMGKSVVLYLRKE